MGSGRLITLTLIIVSIMSILYLSDTKSVSNSLIEILFEGPENMQSGEFYNVLFSLIGALIVTSIVVVGFFGVQVSEIGPYALAASALLTFFIGDIISILVLASNGTGLDSIFGNILTFFMGLIAVAYVMTIVEWIRGGD